MCEGWRLRRVIESMAGPDMTDVRAELRSVQDGFASLRRQFHESRIREEAPNGAARHAAELEIEKGRAELRALTAEGVMACPG